MVGVVPAVPTPCAAVLAERRLEQVTSMTASELKIQEPHTLTFQGCLGFGLFYTWTIILVLYLPEVPSFLTTRNTTELQARRGSGMEVGFGAQEICI